MNFESKSLAFHQVAESNNNQQYIDKNLNIFISKSSYNIAKNFDKLGHFGEENLINSYLIMFIL